MKRYGERYGKSGHPSKPKFVFVYGTLKRGFTNHHLLVDSIYLGVVYTLRRFTLGMDKYHIPYMIDIPNTRIRGELYLVDPSNLAKLDKFENVPKYYNRRKIIVQDRYHTLWTCWCYLQDSTDLPLHIISNYTKHLHSGYVPIQSRDSSHKSIKTRHKP